MIRICCICLDSEECPVITRCGHVYHTECVSVWFNLRAECPMCRQDIESYFADHNLVYLNKNSIPGFQPSGLRSQRGNAFICIAICVFILFIVIGFGLIMRH
jgi:hypothetical protein